MAVSAWTNAASITTVPLFESATETQKESKCLKAIDSSTLVFDLDRGLGMATGLGMDSGMDLEMGMCRDSNMGVGRDSEGRMALSTSKPVGRATTLTLKQGGRAITSFLKPGVGAMILSSQ